MRALWHPESSSNYLVHTQSQRSAVQFYAHSRSLFVSSPPSYHQHPSLLVPDILGRAFKQTPQTPLQPNTHIQRRNNGPSMVSNYWFLNNFGLVAKNWRRQEFIGTSEMFAGRLDDCLVSFMAKIYIVHRIGIVSDFRFSRSCIFLLSFKKICNSFYKLLCDGVCCVAVTRVIHFVLVANWCMC